MPLRFLNLLPEEDAMDDPDEDDDADPMVPGDLWFRGRTPEIAITERDKARRILAGGQ